MSRITKHICISGKVEPVDRITLPVKVACKPELTSTLAQSSESYPPTMYIRIKIIDHHVFDTIYAHLTV